MGRRLLAAVSLIALAASPALAQKASAYHAPKNGWGQPDLQGNWTTATITPLTRLVLADAVYFHGDWQAPFAPNSPRFRKAWVTNLWPKRALYPS